ncbi:TRAP transporter large permease [Desertibaculum subflavum]|uniref:TRAP transporter large permease n=1 Tax=Desertibaculum subflavum TaxID=2268458 RepID=UPI000E66DE91
MLGATLGVLLLLLAISVPVAAALGVLGLVLSNFFSFMPLHLALGDTAWQTSVEYILIAIPLFVLLGEILLRSGIAAGVYAAIAEWVSWLPGGLMHANIGTCTMFAATSGSSVATAATIGTVAIPEIEKRRYDEALFLGTIAAGGTLGILVPPSINIIIYGILTDTSVPQLYLAGFIPGFLLAALFSLTVILFCLFDPKKGGIKVQTSWQRRIATLPNLLPPFGIFLIVVGSIYAGIATPTEAASLGVVAALILAAARGRLSLAMLKLALEGTMRTTAMIMLIILAAGFLNFVLAGIGLTTQLADFLKGLGLGPLGMMMAVIVFYMILGCFMETLSMMITTTPLIAPIVFHLGYDPVWYGILMTVLMEMALITPPVGVNLYVVHGLRGRGSMNEVIRGATPFVLAMGGLIVLLMIFPDIALWLPAQFK